MHNYKELNVWQKSMDLTVWVYNQLTTMLREEIYSLTSQIKEEYSIG